MGGDREPRWGPGPQGGGYRGRQVAVTTRSASGTPFAVSIRVRPPSSVSIALILLAACDVGAVGPGPGDSPDAAVPVDAPPPSFRLAVTGAPSGQLGASLTFTADVTGEHFAGPVALTATGALASWMVTIEPTTVTVADGQTAHATITVRVPTNGEAAPTGQALTVAAAGAPGERTASTTVTVDNVYELPIGTPGATGQHFGPLAGGQLRMRQGARLRIPNTDTIAHRIHSDAGVTGFPHQATSMAAGAAYEVTLGAAGSDTFYCHDHGQGTGVVRLTVQ